MTGMTNGELIAWARDSQAPTPVVDLTSYLAYSNYTKGSARSGL